MRGNTGPQGPQGATGPAGSTSYNAGTLDNIDSSQFLRSDTADTIGATLTMGTQKALVANNFGRGVYGLYSSYVHQHVWSMGTAYNLADNGASVGNLYGISYTHTNVGTGYGANAATGLGHQLNGRANGTLQWALGDGIYSAVTGNVWGASNDGAGSGLDADLLDGQQSAYYWNQASTGLEGTNRISSSSNFNNSVPSGFYQSSSASNMPGSSWYWLIASAQGSPSLPTPIIAIFFFINFPLVYILLYYIFLQSLLLDFRC